jgi:uncharacterized membrane protein
MDKKIFNIFVSGVISLIVMILLLLRERYGSMGPGRGPGGYQNPGASWEIIYQHWYLYLIGFVLVFLLIRLMYFSNDK